MLVQKFQKFIERIQDPCHLVCHYGQNCPAPSIDGNSQESIYGPSGIRRFGFRSVSLATGVGGNGAKFEFSGARALEPGRPVQL